MAIMVQEDFGDDDETSRIKSLALGGDQEALQKVIHSCNKDGTVLLRQGKLKDAFEHFKTAEAMLLAEREESANTALLAVTCNNLGCYYKQVGKFHGALSYLRKALKMEVQLNTDPVTICGTHLNICALLSKLGKHQQALQHAMNALHMMSKKFTEMNFGVSDDECSILAMCYYNVATERSFLKQYDQAAMYFQTGCQVATRLLGKDHPMSIAMETNCAAAMRDSKEAAMKKRQYVRPSAKFDEHDEEEEEDERQRDILHLPPLDQQRANEALHVVEASDWIKDEAAAWSSFADRVLKDRVPEQPSTPSRESSARSARLPQLPSPPASVPPTVPPSPSSRAPDNQVRERSLPPEFADLEMGSEMFTAKPRTAQALAAYKTRTFLMPKTHDMGLFRFTNIQKNQYKLPAVQALDDHPAALLDILDAEVEGVGAKHADHRPNRAMARSSRTSRLLRKTGIQNSTEHRDRVETEMRMRQKLATGVLSSKHEQKIAAERIQRVWRMWQQYCQSNSEWMTVTWICATMIQSHWRSYHVRRVKLDKNATIIQRHMRGALVRKVLKKHKAAVTIQRHVLGMITRTKLVRMHQATINMQRLVRGGIIRKQFAEYKSFKTNAIVTIQKMIRLWLARRITNKKREQRRVETIKHKAAVDMQRFYRGHKGRLRAQEMQKKKEIEFAFNFAALRLQLCVRRRLAKRKVQALLAEKFENMGVAAVYIQKMWRGQSTRKKYLALKKDYLAHVADIVTIQRYLRGCMCRLRLWREAVRAEEELQGAISIQRVWRGYLDRVRWETEYENMWRRELAAAKVQRTVRRWLAHLKVSRMKRTIARREFEQARQRYIAAQKIQAVARGRLARTSVRARLQRAHRAAAQIQRIVRGAQLRTRMWRHIREQKAVLLQALARRFIVRNTRFKLLAKAILIQRTYRHWLRLPVEHRAAKRVYICERKEKATKIQRAFRSYSAAKRIKTIKAMSLEGSGPRPSS